ncbi:MAG: hypothetical protein K9G39_01585 [Chlorobium sp.]|uniref:hypothetical protein n=1 Tax=Chlorobium sp. TaxID=1095 RepID=UPI0025C4F4F7|nr:hypothetical protein [Chlorobium sp.]MCF8382275.1 hypothetical protein [Chlorobium sp.]
MLKLVRFNYLYRDGSNFNRQGSLEFSNPEQLTIEEIENEHSANPARTIGEFLTVVQTSADKGWKAFDPLDHLSRIQARLT